MVNTSNYAQALDIYKRQFFSTSMPECITALGPLVNPEVDRALFGGDPFRCVADMESRQFGTQHC